MGILAYVYRNQLRDCTNGGISATVKGLCIVNAEGTFEPGPDSPAAIVESHHPGCIRVVPAYRDAKGNWAKVPGQFMAGGNIASTSDSRFTAVCERALGHHFYGGVHIHDRQD